MDALHLVVIALYFLLPAAIIAVVLYFVVRAAVLSALRKYSAEQAELLSGAPARGNADF